MNSGWWRWECIQCSLIYAILCCLMCLYKFVTCQLCDIMFLFYYYCSFMLHGAHTVTHLSQYGMKSVQSWRVWALLLMSARLIPHCTQVGSVHVYTKVCMLESFDCTECIPKIIFKITKNYICAIPPSGYLDEISLAVAWFEMTVMVMPHQAIA